MYMLAAWFSFEELQFKKYLHSGVLKTKSAISSAISALGFLKEKLKSGRRGGRWPKTAESKAANQSV